MALIAAATCSFDSQSDATEGITRLGAGTPTYDTSVTRRGYGASIRCFVGTGTSAFITFVPNATGWLHYWVRFDAIPTGPVIIFGSVGASSLNLRLETDGALSLYLDTAAVYSRFTDTTGPGTGLSTGVWYWLGIRLHGGSGVDAIQIDGITRLNGNTGSGFTVYQAGWPALDGTGNKDCYIDEAMEDNAGFLPPSFCHLILPTEDASNNGFRNGNNTGTTNLFASVDSVPPPGVASANETATTNIECASSTGTSQYTTRFPVLSSIPVSEKDNVLALKAYVRHGEDIATGTKTGAGTLFWGGGSTSIAAFSYGGDGGAHGIDNPGIWVTGTAFTTSPTTLFSSQITLQVTKTDTTTRVACVDLMAVLIAWTPIKIAYVPPMPPLIAH